MSQTDEWTFYCLKNKQARIVSHEQFLDHCVAEEHISKVHFN